MGEVIPGLLQPGQGVKVGVGEPTVGVGVKVPVGMSVGVTSTAGVTVGCGVMAQAVLPSSKCCRNMYTSPDWTPVPSDRKALIAQIQGTTLPEAGLVNVPQQEQ